MNNTDSPSNSTNIDSHTTNGTVETNSSNAVQSDTNSNSNSNSDGSSNSNSDGSDSSSNTQGQNGGRSVGMDFEGKATSSVDSSEGSPDIGSQGRVSEVSQHTSTPTAPKEVSMPIAIIICVICLVILIGFGYFRNKDDDDDYYDDIDDEFEYK